MRRDAPGRVARKDGSCTGEHGVGAVKRKHLVREHGEDSVATMRLIKQALDPKGPMNPDKILR